jgi:hypothetical protein
VPVDAFGRVIDSRSVRRIDQSALASVRPTLDPLTLTPLRNAVLHSAWGRGKIDLPPGIAKKLNDTRVVVSADPGEPRFRKDLAKSMRVETVPENSKSQKLNLRDERKGEVAQQPDAGRNQQTQAPAVEEARGNKEGKDAARQVRVSGEAQTASVPQPQKAQEKAQRKAEPQPAKAAPQVQGVRVGHPAKAAEIPRAPKAQPEARKAAAAPQPVKQAAKPAAAAKQERKGPPAQAAEGKGKGKGKHP